MLLIWKWMIPNLFKNHFLKCWICLTSLNWTEAPASSLMFMLYLRKLELWFILSLFLFLSWSLRYFGCRYQGIIQKKYGRIVFLFFFLFFFFCSLGYGGAVSPPGGPGRCPGGGEAPDFFIFFVQNTLKRWSLGEYRVENISNHSVVTLNNVILTFSTIIKLSLRNRQREK